MRKTRSAQLEIGAVPIENIHAGARPRDDIPAILIGLRHFYASQPLRRMLGHSPVLGHLRVADGDRQRVAAESEAAVGDRAAGGRVGAQGGRKKAWRAVARAGRFVLHHRIMWQGGDAGHAAALVEGVMGRFADLRAA